MRALELRCPCRVAQRRRSLRKRLGTRLLQHVSCFTEPALRTLYDVAVRGFCGDAMLT